MRTHKHTHKKGPEWLGDGGYLHNLNFELCEYITYSKLQVIIPDLENQNPLLNVYQNFFNYLP